MCLRDFVDICPYLGCMRCMVECTPSKGIHVTILLAHDPLFTMAEKDTAMAAWLLGIYTAMVATGLCKLHG